MCDCNKLVLPTAFANVMALPGCHTFLLNWPIFLVLLHIRPMTKSRYCGHHTFLLASCLSYCQISDVTSCFQHGGHESFHAKLEDPSFQIGLGKNLLAATCDS